MPIIKRHPHHTRATHRHTADPLLKAVQQGERLTTASSYPGRDLRHTLSIYIQGRIAHFKYVESATYSPTYIDVDSAECYKTRERKRRRFCVRSREAEKPGPLPPDDLTNRTGTALACHASCRRFETKLWSRHPENWSSRGAPFPGDKVELTLENNTELRTNNNTCGGLRLYLPQGATTPRIVASMMRRISGIQSQPWQ